MTQTHLTQTRFDSFGFSRLSCAASGMPASSSAPPFRPRPCPSALAGQDVAGQAQTGTGKTAAFLLAVLHHLLTRRPRRTASRPAARPDPRARRGSWRCRSTGTPRSLAGTPAAYSRWSTAARVTSSSGAMLEAGVDVLIGTPGRLIDYFKQHVFDLHRSRSWCSTRRTACSTSASSRTSASCCGACPQPDRRLNMLFSATLSYRVHRARLRAHEQPGD